MTKNPVIAIDGFSSTGKSSISKVIAQKLDLIHLDTGALYRGITVYALRNHFQDQKINLTALKKDLHNIHLEFRNPQQQLVLFLNNQNINTEIRDPKVSEFVSIVAKEAEVRNFLLTTQRAMAEQGGIIMDGRDIGTVVLPNADYKFFLTASTEERTRRRVLELQSQGVNADFEEVKANLLMRDKIDSEREISPLKQAEDAILIDNTSINKEQTIDLILSYIKK
ncbi:(d)CMP kinase [Elizabethkingia sp. JS20170427COW]|uniref:(d)CMP kinase n=1 Tax=Elizabethkingia sp. JS20170427COW TaxID=2583851 RepID=UPI0011106A99|nr:(d)CMP kinase [Elizabethkingia sp. JS20170427COW]QCX52558.1 (d)CMP kinase [Elizabethkingia sp. JS20170427COW]